MIAEKRKLFFSFLHAFHQLAVAQARCNSGDLLALPLPLQYHCEYIARQLVRVAN